MFRRVYTSKLRPNRQQREKLAATLELCRNLYSCALEQRKVQRINPYEQKRQLESLRIQSLSQGFLAKQGHDAGWGTFLRMLSYKAEEAARVAVGVDCTYTRQTCPMCGEIKKKSLGERVHRCDCGSTAHRDTAAAPVILGRTAPFGANVGERIPWVA